MSSDRLQILPDGSITSVPGFEAAGVVAGLKPNGQLDLALVYSQYPCVGAGVFTTNAFKAAPVLYDQRVLKRNPAGLRGVVINSGCANACTGEQGMRDAEATAAAAADALGVAADDIAVMSTGVIGQPLPMHKIVPGVQQAARVKSAAVEAGHAASRAIMTTDTRPKVAAVRMTGETGTFTVAGMVKGSGMICPNMATMLSVIVTDARLTPELAQAALREAVEVSYNRITVDGDMSTNDTVMLLANGAADMQPITSRDAADYQHFVYALTQVATALAQAVVRDGEGATRFIEIAVSGARTRAEARQVAMSVANSALVKTAIYGQDANWGRIVCAVGYSGVELDPAWVGVWLGDLELVRDGAPYEVNEERASAILAQTDIPIRITLGQGDAEAIVWTCDFSHKYVDINAHYRT
ncbi:MAG: bifunctional glutamate N-acetyltransferase/amino-acid acetyltransferase ArgJ [Chloroflexi bacterium]|nr:bifunctional glutamate N-acetyltransferase/amino-acid acetyltransferase ArgJ [Chloroflexota bacterium]